MSHYIKQYKQDYYAHLQAVRDTSDWQRWLSFFLRALSKVRREAVATARNILDMGEEFRHRITYKLGRAAGNAQQVIDYLFMYPIITIKSVKELPGITQAGANNIVNRLVEIYLLKEITGYAHNRRSRFDPYLRFSEEKSKS